MKIFYILPISFLLIFTLSCTTTEKKADSKKTTIQNKTKENKSPASKNLKRSNTKTKQQPSTNNKKTQPKTNANAKSKTPSYEDQLAKELNLSQNQKKQVGKARADYFKAKRALNNAKNRKVEIQKLDNKLKADFRRILGATLYQKQLIFDKKYIQQKRKEQR